MKTKKFNLNLQSVLLGMMLCMVLVVFLGSKAANPQTPAQVMTGTVQNAVTITDVWNKTVAMEARLIQVEKKINRLGEQMDYLLKNMEREWKQGKK